MQFALPVTARAVPVFPFGRFLWEITLRRVFLQVEETRTAPAPVSASKKTVLTSCYELSSEMPKHGRSKCGQTETLAKRALMSAKERKRKEHKRA